MGLYDAQTAIKMTTEERQAWEAAAAECKMTMQTWMRMVLDHAAGATPLFDQAQEARHAHLAKQAEVMREARASKRGVADEEDAAAAP